MSAQVDLLIAQLRLQRTSTNYEPVIAIYDNLIAALVQLDSGAGTGTVTSVGLDLDAGLYTVSGSPVINAGTLTGTLNTQAANLVYAGPGTGAAAKPTFRALVAADLPGGAGTVSSVGVVFSGAQSSQWNVSGSPVTSSGNITLTMLNQSGNKLLASPAGGGAGNPDFRTLVAADLNSLAFTAGSVPFGNASGGLSQNNAKLFFDNTNFRLGIGTASPLMLLHGSANASTAPAAPTTTGFYYQGADTVASAFTIDSYGANSSYIARISSGTAAAPGAITNAMSVGSFQAQGWDSTIYAVGANTVFTATENWTAAAHGVLYLIRLTPTGSTVRTTKLTVYDDGRLAPVGAYVDQSYSRQAPATGATINLANIVGQLILVPAGALAALTVNFPAAPYDGQRLGISSTQTVAALTLAYAGGTIQAPLTAIAAAGTFGSFGSWEYVLADTTWYRIS